MLLIPPRARISISGLVGMHAIPRRFIFAPPSPLLLYPIIASVRKVRECVCQKHQSRRDPAFFTPRRGIHMIAQGRAQRRSREAPPWVNGPRHAPRPERAKHSGGAEQATIIHQKPPIIWFSCRPVRRQNQDTAYRGVPCSSQVGFVGNRYLQPRQHNPKNRFSVVDSSNRLSISHPRDSLFAARRHALSAWRCRRSALEGN